MDFLPVKKKRLYQEIVEQLKGKIEKGEIAYGDKLPSERVLAKKFSVSRSSVKEAFSVLQAEGVVEIRQGSGVYLRKSNKEDTFARLNAIIQGMPVNISELMEMRLAIERDAAYYAALRASDEDIKQIHEAFCELEKAVNQDNIAAEEDLNFHIAIARAARNSVFEKVMYTLYDQLLEGLRESRMRTLNIPNKSKIILEEHRLIYQAIRDGESLQAKKAMESHLQKIRERYL